MDMPRKVRDEDLMCLDGHRWLNDEVIFAFVSAVSQDTRFSPLDPCLIQTANTYKVSSYPIHDGELLFPLNMRKGTHWGLAWLRPLFRRIVLYDSMSFLYNYSTQLLPKEEKILLESIWRKVTDRQLDEIVIAAQGLVHKQEDGFNCGVFVCLYAERLCKDEPTVQENATYAFLQSYRHYIRNRLTCHSIMPNMISSDRCGLDFDYTVGCEKVDDHTVAMSQNLCDKDLQCLNGDCWLNDEVILTFISVVSKGTRFSPLHPCLIQTAATYRVPSYPVLDAELLFPLNMKRGTHWGLAWLRPLYRTIVLYDSMSYLYKYSTRLLPTEDKNLLEITWRKVTDRQLDKIIVAAQGLVHEQEDGFNCGVFVCLYAERLCKEVPTVQESATYAFLQSYRQYIKDQITRCKLLPNKVVSKLHNSSEKTDTCWDEKKASRIDISNNCAEHDVIKLLPSRLESENRSEIYIQKESDARYEGRNMTPYCIFSQPKIARKVARIENLEGCRSSSKHSLLEETLSPCLLVRYLRKKYSEYNLITFASFDCETCRDQATGDALHGSYASLIFLYLNKTKHFGVVIVTKGIKRSHATVFDCTTRSLAREFRTQIKDAAREYGFGEITVKKSFLTTDRKQIRIEVEAVAICMLVEKTVRHCFSAEVQIPTDEQVEVVLEDIQSTLNITLSSPAPHKKKISSAFSSSAYPEFFTIGEMDKSCPNCEAMLFNGERSICCSDGQVVIPESMFNPRRDPLLDWFWEAALKNEQLFYMIRPINNLVACAGVCINLKSFEGSCAQRPLVLQGRFDIGLCHLNPNSEKACFAQLFIADDFKVQHSLQETMKLWDTKVEYGLIRKLIDILRKHNPIVQCYMTMYEIYLDEKKKSGCKNADDIPKVVMNLKEKRDVPQVVASNIHPGRLNVPVFENQVAAIYVSKDGGMLSHEELDEGLRIQSRGGKTIAAHHSYNIDALTYPLLFPRGEQTFVKDMLPKRKALSRKRKEDIVATDILEMTDPDSFKDFNGIQQELEHSKKTRFISRREFALYIMARRGDVQKHRIIGTGKLYAQYVLHIFARIEADRLCSIGLHRTELRSSTASSLFKYLDEKLNEKGVKLGKLVNMPQSYVGSRRWYQKLYSDAMAVAQRLGKPDLFITFTGSQDWPEIKNNLAGKFDSWITDPFLCCRVFFLRLTELLDDIKRKEIFGKVIALHGSIEFQKRGMPHAHLLITLANKIDTPEKIDSIISAEIPEYPKTGDPHRKEKLHLIDLVGKFMIHGPCSERPNLRCREADVSKCSKGFPKPYRSFTEICNGGYPLYRRRNDGRVIPVGKLGKTFASNKDVVPTNHRLLMKHECHINVEVCGAIQAFKYIFKYIFKGPDSVVIELLQDDKLMEKSVYSNEQNEKLVTIDMREVYRLARYVSHIEAAYRILGYPMQYASHTVISLMPHLPDEQPVFFRGTPPLGRFKSKLLAYFELASRDDNVKDMTWIDVAENYRFTGSKYVPYKHKSARIAKLCSVNPKMRELYAVRKLLLYRKGVKSFEDLRTYNGKVYDTFMEAAQAAGYIEKSSEWEECLRCACTTEMPSTIRRLFAHILLYCKPSNIVELWHKFKAEMRTRNTNHSNRNEDLNSLKHIEDVINANGMTLANCGLDVVMDKLLEEYDDDCNPCVSNIDDDEGMNAEPVAYNLNKKQEEIVMRVTAAAKLSKTSKGRVFFVYGKAGCGKTYTFNALIHALESSGLKVIAVASTGIAATLLKDGRTAHSTFSLPLELNSDSVANVDASSVQGKMLRDVDVIVWDEISMQTRYAVECVDRLLRDVAAPDNRSQPFGGVVMVFGGDWCQFLPVIPGATKVDTIHATLKLSALWDSMQVLVLDENMRLYPGEEDHAAWLRAVGEGRNLKGDGSIDIPTEMCMESEEDVIKWMYSEEVLRSPQLMGKMALLTVRNCDALELNEKVLNMTSGDLIEIYAIDTPLTEEEGTVGMPCEDEEFLHDLTPPGMPQYKLLLKPGAIIMLLRNIDVGRRMVNGTRLEVLEIMCDKRLLRCRNLLTGKCDYITRMPLDYADNNTGVTFRRFQFPVRLSYCMTINKSQGQTFEKVGIILRTPSFAHGSTYVALSRARSKTQVKITINSRRRVQQSFSIRNIVYSDII